MANLVSWDSCVFLGWFKQEPDKPLADIEAYLKAIAAGKVNLLVSVVCAVEVLDQDTGDYGNQFQEFMKRTSVTALNTDMRVAKQAAIFRQNGARARKLGIINDGFKAPDAMIVASAYVYQAEVLHTFDPVLLALSETEYVNGLRIEHPLFYEEQPLFENLANPK